MLPTYFGRDWLCDRPGNLKHIYGYCNPDGRQGSTSRPRRRSTAEQANALLTEVERMVDRGRRSALLDARPEPAGAVRQRPRLRAAAVLVRGLPEHLGGGVAVLSLIVRRTAMAVPILLGVTVIVFLLMTVLPGDPAAGVPAPRTPRRPSARRSGPSSASTTRCRSATCTGSATTLQGDLGYSPYRRRDVADLLVQAWLNTVAAGRGARRCSASSAASRWARMRRCGGAGSADRVVSFFSLTGLSVPSFFVAIVLLIVFSATLSWLPVGRARARRGPGRVPAPPGDADVRRRARHARASPRGSPGPASSRPTAPTSCRRCGRRG